MRPGRARLSTAATAVAGAVLATAVIATSLASGNRMPRAAAAATPTSVPLSTAGSPAPGLGTAGIPSPREGAAVAYDPTSGSVLMYGGDNGTVTFGDTWSWDGSGWSELNPPSSPPPLTQATMAYDPQSQRAVLSGGSSGPSGAPASAGSWEASGSTWTWDGATWAAAPRGDLPAAVAGDVMATDTASGQLILVTGLDGTCSPPSTWRWTAGTWTQLHLAASPSPAGLGKLAYDPSSRRLVLYTAPTGQCPAAAASPPLAEAWSWDGSTWSLSGAMTQLPTSSDSLKITFSGRPVGSAHDGVLMMAWGAFTWSAQGWNQLATAPGALGMLASNGNPWRGGEALAYDSADGQVLLFGGDYSGGDSQEYVSDTWTWNGAWTLAEAGAVGMPTPPTPGPIAYFQPWSMDFVNDETGWVVGDACDAQQNCTPGMARTTDGGATWSLLPPPPKELWGSESDVYTGHPAIYFTSAEDGWIFDPGLAATTDGGESWTVGTPPGAGQVTGLVSFDGSLWALTACSSGSGCASTLWRSAGPGLPFTRAPSQPPPPGRGPGLLRSGPDGRFAADTGLVPVRAGQRTPERG